MTTPTSRCHETGYNQVAAEAVATEQETDTLRQLSAQQRQTRQESGGCCGRVLSWVRYIVSSPVRLFITINALIVIGRRLTEIDTSTWGHQCPVSKDLILRRYDQQFQDWAAHSKTMHDLVAGKNLPRNRTAICLTNSWPYLLDELQVTRCYSNGEEVPVADVEIRERSESSSSSQSGTRRINLQHMYH